VHFTFRHQLYNLYHADVVVHLPVTEQVGRIDAGDNGSRGTVTVCFPESRNVDN
jgi:hypothetical protein